MLSLEHLASLLENHRSAAAVPVKEFFIGGRPFAFNTHPAIMGVVNLSADSWYRESVCLSADSAIQRGRVLAAQGAAIFSVAAGRLANTSYFAFPGIDGETLVGRLDRAGFAVAAGAACSAANPEPSHVLLAMGIASSLARGAVRVSLGADNTAAQIRDFLAALKTTILQLKGLTALTS